MPNARAGRAFAGVGVFLLVLPACCRVEVLGFRARWE